jgi:fatty acid desaturase
MEMVGSATRTPGVLETAERSWRRWTLLGVGAIWLGVVAASIVAPDLVSGSQQEHLPLAAFLTWIWGLLATVGYLWGMSKLRGRPDGRGSWVGLTVATIIIWAVAVVLSAALPVWETGSDPTSLPIWALIAPLAAALLVTLASVIAGIFSDTPNHPTTP